MERICRMGYFSREYDKVDEVNCYLSTQELMRELLGSIRDINQRLCEMRWFIDNKMFKDKETFRKIRDRVGRLKESRMNIAYSIYDIRQSFLKQMDREELDDAFKISTLLKEVRRL